MTREEAIGQLTRLRSYCSAETGTDDRDAASIWKADAEALSIAIAALNGPTRKMVERFAEEWQGIADGYADGELVYDMWSCSNCGYSGAFAGTLRGAGAFVHGARQRRLRQHGEVRPRDVHGLFRIIERERVFDMV